MRALALVLLLSVPALAAKQKVLVDAPKPVKALLEKQLKKTYTTAPVTLESEPSGGDVKQACLNAGGAIAVVTARLAGGQYTVMVLNGANGDPLSSFRFKAPLGKRPLKALPKDAAPSLKAGLADARAPKKEVAPPPEPVEPKVTPKETPRPVEVTPRPTNPPPPAEVREPVDEVVTRVEPVKKDKPQALRISLGGGIFSRRFFYSDDLFGVLSRYRLGIGAAPHVEAEVYPAAFVTNGFAANIGLVAGADFAVGLSSSRYDEATDTTFKYSTSALKLRVALTVKIPVGPLTIAPFVGYSLQTFYIGADQSGDRPNIPGVAYSGLRFGGTIRVQPVKQFGVQLTAAGQFLFNTGEIRTAAYFPRSKASAFDVQLAIPIAITKNFEIRAYGGYDRYWYSMNPDPADVLRARSPVERWTITGTPVSPSVSPCRWRTRCSSRASTFAMSGCPTTARCCCRRCRCRRSSSSKTTSSKRSTSRSAARRCRSASTPRRRSAS